MKISKLRSHENGKHYFQKQYLYQWILDEKVTFMTQDNKKYKINMDNISFSTMESYIFTCSSEIYPYYQEDCLNCFHLKNYKKSLLSNYLNKEELNLYNKVLELDKIKEKILYSISDLDNTKEDNLKLNKELEYYDIKQREIWKELPNLIWRKLEKYDKETPEIINDFINKNMENRFFNNDYNKNLIIKDDEKEYFKIHPCNFCRFKDENDVLFIFDIALHNNQKKLQYAIEVYNTSQVKPNKIKYCKKNFITLFEVNVKELLKNSLVEGEKYIHCKEYY